MKPRLPEGPPPLHERVELSEQQIQKLAEELAALSASLDSLPVVLSQDGEVVGFAGTQDVEIADRIAKMADRIWREGATRIARELIRFEEETVSDMSERSNFLLYSAHLSGALVLTIGWQMSVSLTQVRAEVADAISSLKRILAG